MAEVTDRAQIEAILASGKISAEDRKILEKALKGGGKAKRKGEEHFLAKGPHVIPGTLDYDADARKQFMMIECQHPGCDKQRRVYTSDLHQVSMCTDHAAEQAKARKKAEQERVKAILAKADAEKS